MRVCEMCEEADISHRPGKCKRCDECQKKYVKWYRKQRSRERREYGYDYITLGTIDCNSHMERNKDGTPNFELEALRIKNQKKRLGLA